MHGLEGEEGNLRFMIAVVRCVHFVHVELRLQVSEFGA